MKDTVRQVMEEYIGVEFYKYVSDFKDLQWTEEIRIRNKSPIIFNILGEKFYLTKNGLSKSSVDAYIADSKLIESIFNKITNYSLYAFNEEIKKGYITLIGGHRVGISGETVFENGEILTIKNIWSYNFRISKEIIGASKKIMDLIGKNFGHTLIFGSPSTGKTTILKDMINELSKNYNVSVIDERCELMGFKSNIDILKNCPKAIGMMTMLRSMAPEVICVDEIGKEEDVISIEEIINCGVVIVASIHGKNMEELKNKLYVGNLISKNTFDFYVELGRPLGKNVKIYDRYKNRIL